MDISIIIVSFNTKKLLDRCLSSVKHSLKQSTNTYEIIVIDNNSTDGSIDLVKKSYPDVHVIQNDQNVGFGKANNQGIKKAKGEFVLLLNSDCVVHDQAIDTLAVFLQSKRKTGVHAIAGGKLLNEDGSPQASCGPFYSLSVVFAMLFLKGDTLNITRYSPAKECTVDWISGACLMACRKDMLAIQGFDESIFLYMEEIDLLYRAKKHGYTVYFTPHAVFTHTGAASSGNKKEPVINIYKGLDVFYNKHHSRFERKLLRGMLRLKAWLVQIICGIMGIQELSRLYAKALAALG